MHCNLNDYCCCLKFLKYERTGKMVFFNCAPCACLLLVSIDFFSIKNLTLHPQKDNIQYIQGCVTT